MSKSTDTLALPEYKKVRAFRLGHDMVAILCLLEKHKEIKREVIIKFLSREIGTAPSSAKSALTSLESSSYIGNKGDLLSLSELGKQLASVLKAKGYGKPLE